ncbi:MAG: NAD(+) synthase [Clostridia bacterium]|nr:NAD(+) synthase [Clostridia bacterium]
MQGILRVAAAVPHLYLGNVDRNVQAHLEKINEAKEKHATVVVFPELSLTGASCGDLFRQKTLQEAVLAGLMAIRDGMPEGIAAVVGAPIAWCGKLYDCGVVMCRGEFLGGVPKMYIPAGQTRWFRSGCELDPEKTYYPADGLTLENDLYLRGTDGASFAVTFADDLCAPIPPATKQTMAGAETVLCLSSAPTMVGSRERIRDKVRQFSADCLCGCLYVEAGPGESTADVLCGGGTAAAECGESLRESAAFIADDYLLTADFDLERIAADRLRSSVFADCALRHNADDHGEDCVGLPLLLPPDVLPDLHIPQNPFVPDDPDRCTRRCLEVFDIQAHGLARRMQITGGKVVVGISGGLDSTLALLVACRAVDILHLLRTNILGVTMPCFGTTDHTYQSALDLMTALGVQQKEVRIHKAVRQHFDDIGHDEAIRDVTYENAQARERTQVLMDLSNQFGGIVLGTGDLSEIALGWCTYNGDHMSMYGVNAGVPKTLVRHVTRTVSEQPDFAAAREVLLRILDTPISPELLPPDEKGDIAQQTEDIVGPYALHDFFLYYAVRYGYAPSRIYEMCCIAFREEYDPAVILKWLKNFYRRFFTQQFKRNCSPDGAAVGSVSLSPRGAWAMPSDAQAAAWLNACEEIVP